MSPIISSAVIQFDFDPVLGRMNFRFPGSDTPEILAATIAFQGQKADRLIHWNATDNVPQITASSFSTPLGERDGWQARWEMDQGSVMIEMQLGLLSEKMVGWQVKIHNTGEHSLILKQVSLLEAGARLYSNLTSSADSEGLHSGPGMLFSHTDSNPAFFVNGYQSWSSSWSLGYNERMPCTRYRMFIEPFHRSSMVKMPTGTGHFKSDMFAVAGCRKHGAGLLLGFLQQRQAFGHVEIRFRDAHQAAIGLWEDGDDVIIPSGQEFVSDWALAMPVDVHDYDPLADYYQAVAQANQVRGPYASPVGWCSWYHFFEDLSERDIQNNLAWISAHREDIPIETVQIDDGFEPQVGDWYTPTAEFPDGVAPLAKEIKTQGFEPALWLAPFIIKCSHPYTRKHPDWILSNKKGRQLNAGFCWNTLTRGLDVSNPAVLELTRELIATAAHTWGYRYLKLDFLYAAALPGSRRFDMSLTRAQALYRAFRTIRTAAGEDVMLLGCGCPLGTGIGVFDYMRTTTDVAPSWNPRFLGIERIFKQEYQFPATRNAILNIYTRMAMHDRWWVNDPDCILFRDRDTHMTPAEIQSLISAVSLSGGSLLASDDMSLLSEERINWFKCLIPLLPRAAFVADWFNSSFPEKIILPIQGAAGKWSLCALVNWENREVIRTLSPSDFKLDSAVAYHAREFWRGEVEVIPAHGKIDVRIPAHGTAFFALRELTGEPAWVGDTLHISQGMLVQEWKLSEGKLQLLLSSEAARTGSIFLYLPQKPARITVGTNEVSVQYPDNQVVQIPVDFCGELCVQLTFEA